MRLGIDASNIRDGGGLTHLHELLRAAQPQEHGIRKISVWAGAKTLRQLMPKPWLERLYEPLLDQSLPARLYWQKVKLPRLAQQNCDCLFAPGGSCDGSFHPVVAESQNLLPFEQAELARYGLSPLAAKFTLLRFRQVRSFRQAEGMIFLTEYARSIITRDVKLKGPARIIPHGINGRFRAAPRAQKPISTYSPGRPFKLLYVSRVEPYKHQWQVVAAVAQLKKAGLPISLDLIGPATHPASAELLRQAIYRVDPCESFIRYRAEIPYTELPSYYCRADAFVFASSCENLPNILLEAMAAGLPCACAQRGPMPEVLRDAGVYFNPEKSNEIANAIGALLTDHALREQCAWRAHTYAQAYSWERCAGETFACLTAVAQQVGDRVPLLRSLAKPVSH
jgi:glycosyltransferase involved in cell wall biosynthesis